MTTPWNVNESDEWAAMTPDDMRNIADMRAELASKFEQPTIAENSTRLKPISELTDKDAQMNAWGLGWTALDTNSGAYLFRTNGRTLTAPKYILILPDTCPAERRSLFTNCSFGYPYGRKIVRAWSDEEAIELANGKLPKMLEQQAKAQR